MTRFPKFAKVAFLLCVMAAFVAVSTLALAGDDEMVAFNTKSHKYHCLSCQYAVKCTQNCIQIKRSDAIARGGGPGKVCGGSLQGEALHTTAAKPPRILEGPPVGGVGKCGGGAAVR